MDGVSSICLVIAAGLLSVTLMLYAMLNPLYRIAAALEKDDGGDDDDDDDSTLSPHHGPHSRIWNN